MWLFWLAAASMICVIAASILQLRARKTPGWRFFLCSIYAFAFAPTLFPAVSHGVGLVPAPAGLVLLASILAWDPFIFFVLAALPISIVASLVFCMWSLQINAPTEDPSKKKDVFRCYQYKGIIESGQEECSSCHWTWK